MEIIEYNDEFFNIIAPVVKASGYEIVEIVTRNLSDGLHIHIVLSSINGISINDCSKVHRTVQRRIEAYTGERELFLEVSSPGITRNLKSANEFFVFTGKNVSILVNDSNEWTRYKIIEADNSGVLLEINRENTDSIETDDQERVKLNYSEIRKAKLDF